MGGTHEIFSIYIHLFLYSTLAFSFSNDQLIILPQNNQVSLLNENDGIFQFSGEFELRGLVVARWGKSSQFDLVSNEKILYLQFFPEQEETKKLPYINDEYNNSSKTISLNYQ